MPRDGTARPGTNRCCVFCRASVTGSPLRASIKVGIGSACTADGAPCAHRGRPAATKPAVAEADSKSAWRRVSAVGFDMARSFGSAQSEQAYGCDWPLDARAPRGFERRRADTAAAIDRVSAYAAGCPRTRRAFDQGRRPDPGGCRWPWPFALRRASQAARRQPPSRHRTALCPCSRILVTKAKRSAGVILLTTSGSTLSRAVFMRGCGVLDSLGVFRPGRLLSRRDCRVRLSTHRSVPDRRSLAGAAVHHSWPHAFHHAGPCPIIPGPIP